MIVHNKQDNTFTLHTRNTTYQMKVDQYGVLLHTYYGARVTDMDLSCLIRQADRGFSPNPGEAGHCRVYSLDTLPQEYSTCGVGDFRLPSLELELLGAEDVVIAYAPPAPPRPLWQWAKTLFVCGICFFPCHSMSSFPESLPVGAMPSPRVSRRRNP